MEIIHFPEGESPVRRAPGQPLPEKGFLWLDFSREGEPDWPTVVERQLGVKVHERHVRDSFNRAHPSFYDGMREYDMLVFRSLSPGDELGRIETRATAFFLFDRTLVTVRPADSRSLANLRERLLEAGAAPLSGDPVTLLYMALNAVVDRFLALREPLVQLFERWGERLLATRHPSNLRPVLAYRTRMRRLESLAEEQEDAVAAWRVNSRLAIDPQLAVRYNDLLEHIRRISSFARHQQQEAEELVQLHFSAVSTRTNEIMRTLTVLSAIFLPLNLVAGVFGMNFEHIPQLHAAYGFYVTLGGMLLLAVLLLLYFRFKRWF